MDIFKAINLELTQYHDFTSKQTPAPIQESPLF